MSLYSKSLITYGLFCLILFLLFPTLFILFWNEQTIYTIISISIVIFIALFLFVYKNIYKSEALAKARRRYNENIDFLEVLPNSLFIWKLSIWILTIFMLFTAVLASYMSGEGFLIMYPLWMMGTGLLFSVAGFLYQPKLKIAGERILLIGTIDTLLLIAQLQLQILDIYSAHYIQMAIAAITLGIYPIWLGIRNVR